MNTNVELYFGPMFSGKTKILMENLNNCNFMYDNVNGFKNFYILHSSDKERKMLSHNNFIENFKNKVDIIYTEKLMGCLPSNNIKGETYEIGCVCIDEAQFYKDLYEFVTFLIESKKVHNIYIGGLDGDYRMKEFPNSKIFNIIPLCNRVKKLKSICSLCLENNKKVNSASFTMLKKNILKHNEEEILIGGGEKYISCCRICFLNN